MHIDLREGDLDSLFVERLLDLLKKIEMHRPVVGILAPDTGRQRDAARCVLRNVNLGRGIIQNQRISRADAENDRFRRLEIHAVADRKVHVNSTDILLGVVDDLAGRQFSVRYVNYLVVRRPDLCVADVNILDKILATPIQQ